MSEIQNGQAEIVAPATEVVVKAKRRQYSSEYKLKLLKEIDLCQGNGDIGAILRREGLYSSMLSKWKFQRENGALQGLSAQKRGPKPEPLADELACAQRENARLREHLRRAELIIEVQKKVSELLGLPLEPSQLGARP
jgi:transposase-like protein